MQTQKTYYQEDNCEFAQGLGTIYTEFMGQIATRQITIINSKSYLSSLSQDFYEKDFMLYDGEKDELDLSSAKEITAEEFDSVWLSHLTQDEIESRLTYLEGDATIPLKKNSIIIHIVNGLGKWGRGFVLPLGKKYPKAKESYETWFEVKENFKLGNIDVSLVDEEKKIYVAHMLAQQDIKKNKSDQNCYVDYKALESCLAKVADFALAHHLTVQCPMIGVGLAGGDWEVISKLLLEILCSKKISCTVLQLTKE